VLLEDLKNKLLVAHGVGADIESIVDGYGAEIFLSMKYEIHGAENLCWFFKLTEGTREELHNAVSEDETYAEEYKDLLELMESEWLGLFGDDDEYPDEEMAEHELKVNQLIEEKTAELADEFVKEKLIGLVIELGPRVRDRYDIIGN
jgi:hypothetical protein